MEPKTIEGGFWSEPDIEAKKDKPETQSAKQTEIPAQEVRVTASPPRNDRAKPAFSFAERALNYAHECAVSRSRKALPRLLVTDFVL
jgi:hypothetical protein